MFKHHKNLSSFVTHKQLIAYLCKIEAKLEDCGTGVTLDTNTKIQQLTLENIDGNPDKLRLIIIDTDGTKHISNQILTLDNQDAAKTLISNDITIGDIVFNSNTHSVQDVLEAINVLLGANPRIVEVDDNYVVLPIDATIIVNNNPNLPVRTIVLPNPSLVYDNATKTGQVFTIKKRRVSVDVIIKTTNGVISFDEDYMTPDATFILKDPYLAIKLQSTGTNYQTY